MRWAFTHLDLSPLLNYGLLEGHWNPVSPHEKVSLGGALRVGRAGDDHFGTLLWVGPGTCSVPLNYILISICTLSYHN